MKQLLTKLAQHQTLHYAESKQLVLDLVGGKYSDNQAAALLTAFIFKPITLDELRGFRDALIGLSHTVDLGERRLIDVCGTGGDEKNTFNISTLSSFVLAGVGIPVAKHGNYGVSSISGSSSVMEYLGVRFTNEEQVLRQYLEEANICFLHAPLFNPALKHIGPVRKELGVKTFFNMLGPLVNPSRPQVQMIGVFSMELLRMYQYLFQNETQEYCLIHALDGYDECSLTSDCKATTRHGERILSASDFGYSQLCEKEIRGGNSVEESAGIFYQILKGKGSEAQNSVVIANAALAIQTYYPELELENAVVLAEESLLGGKALEKFNILRKL